jgi:hypothetical protein
MLTADDALAAAGVLREVSAGHEDAADAAAIAARRDGMTTGERTLNPGFAGLRAFLIAAGVTAESPDHLDPEGEQLAREERQS